MVEDLFFVIEQAMEADDVRAGVIEEGALANLVMWQTDHPSMWPGSQPLRALAFGDTSMAIHNVMIGGQWRGEDGAYQASVLGSAAYEEARAEAEAAWTRLMRRAGV